MTRDVSAASLADLRDSLATIDREISCIYGTAEAATRELSAKRRAITKEIARRRATQFQEGMVVFRPERE